MYGSCRPSWGGCDRKADALWSIPATPKSWRPSNKGTPCSVASKASGGCGSKVDKTACSLSQGLNLTRRQKPRPSASPSARYGGQVATSAQYLRKGGRSQPHRWLHRFVELTLTTVSSGSTQKPWSRQALVA